MDNVEGSEQVQTEDIPTTIYWWSVSIDVNSKRWKVEIMAYSEQQAQELLAKELKQFSEANVEIVEFKRDWSRSRIG
jgi:hypothetical protein